jgi:hypothetical protein
MFYKQDLIMEIIYLILISFVLVILAVGAMSIRVLFSKDGKFSGGSCRSSPGLEERGITCGCGRQESCATGDERRVKKEEKEKQLDFNDFKYLQN